MLFVVTSNYTKESFASSFTEKWKVPIMEDHAT
jgi:hypothetical protein